MASFDMWMEDRQTEWRAAHVVSQEMGWQNGVQRRWILPSDSWEQGLWPGIASGAEDSLPAYLEKHRVQKHAGAHNLKSSWTQCANLYLPFRASPDGRSLFASFLKRHVDADIDSLDKIELEYADEGDLHPSRLLGERRGGRGANQTSPDLGLAVNGGRGLVLVESKLTEHSFYDCSASKANDRYGRPVNPDSERCNHPVDVARDPANLCHQATWGRRYWEHLAPVVDLDALAALPHCPAAKNGYQLFRQQALAEGIARSGKYDLVVSAVVVDERNVSLDAALRRSGVAGLGQWGNDVPRQGAVCRLHPSAMGCLGAGTRHRRSMERLAALRTVEIRPGRVTEMPASP